MIIQESNNSTKIKKDGAYVINLEAYKSTGNPWVALHRNKNNVTINTENVFINKK